MTASPAWLIIGTSSGLGLSPVRRALDAGHHVIATTRGTALPITAENLTVLQLDPADRAACRQVVDEATQITGRLDGLVNNAGYGLVGAIEEVTEEQARAIIDVDLLGPLWLTQAVLPIMRAQQAGDIVQISSVGGVGAMPFFGMYNAAKWALEGFSEALAGDVTAVGIQVIITEIGSMDTQWATAGMQSSWPLGEYDAVRAQALGTAEVPWPSEPGGQLAVEHHQNVSPMQSFHVAEPSSRPFRLVTGNDAAAQISTVPDLRKQDYAIQAAFTRETE